MLTAAPTRGWAKKTAKSLLGPDAPGTAVTSLSKALESLRERWETEAFERGKACARAEIRANVNESLNRLIAGIERERLDLHGKCE